LPGVPNQRETPKSYITEFELCFKNHNFTKCKLLAKEHILEGMKRVL